MAPRNTLSQPGQPGTQILKLPAKRCLCRQRTRHKQVPARARCAVISKGGSQEPSNHGSGG